MTLSPRRHDERARPDFLVQPHNRTDDPRRRVLFRGVLILLPQARLEVHPQLCNCGPNAEYTDAGDDACGASTTIHCVEQCFRDSCGNGVSARSGLLGVGHAYR